MNGKSMSFVQEFVGFIKKFGVIGLAIGVVIGGAVSKLVASLVENIVTPIVGIFLGGVDFNGLSLTVGKSAIEYGKFITSSIDFLILLFVVYIAVKLVVSRMLTDKEKEDLGM
jgi:large conductance mechanosensitive channel